MDCFIGFISLPFNLMVSACPVKILEIGRAVVGHEKMLC